MAEHPKIMAEDSAGQYEANIIGFKGIIYFGLGLFALIVVTFVLMWAFQYRVLEPRAKETDERNRNPLALTQEERLPPEPRLQSAPGFGVDSPNGRVNLELREPAAEYEELLKQWNDELENGQKDEKTGTVITLPIREAKSRLLKDGAVRSRSAEEAKATLKEAAWMFSASSSGRVASERRY